MKHGSLTLCFALYARAWRGLARWVAAIVLSITFQTANAVLPVPSPPCPTNLSSKSAERLANRIADTTKEDWWRACAANSLVQKGADAIPILIRLLKNGDLSTQLLAMDYVSEAKTHGGSMREIVPIIVQDLKTYNPNDPAMRGEVYRIYWALEFLGKDAKPAIPILIEKSRSDVPGIPVPESHWAIRTLGRIGKYDAARVVPHLVQLLDEPSRRVDAANALADMAASARSAVPTLTRHLEGGVISPGDKFSESLMWALARCGDSSTTVATLTPLLLAPGLELQAANALRGIGPAARPAIPYLLSRLENSSSPAQEKIIDVLALLAIDPDSIETLKRILAQAVRDNSYDIADQLAHAKALPAGLAPDLQLAINTSPDPHLRQLYIDALEHIHASTSHAISHSKSP
jgi:hypothetical protein